MPSLCLSQEACDSIEEYAQVAGITVERAASEAIMKWMESTGYDVMSVLRARNRKKRVAAPKPIKISRPVLVMGNRGTERIASVQTA